MLGLLRSLSGIESGLLYIALAVFGGAAMVGFGVVAGRRRGHSLKTMLTVGAIALTALLVVRTARLGKFPIGQKYEILVVAAWALALMAQVVERRLQLRVLSAVAAPTLALLLFFAVLLVPTAGTGPVDVRIGKITHILLALLGFSAFAFAAGVAVLYLWEISVLKSNPQAALSRRLPPLEVLDHLNFVAVAFGFPFLALSVLGGWIFLARSIDAGWWLDPTVLATLTGLLVYLVLFGTRALLGWRGRRIAWLTVIGFGVIILGFVVGAYCTSDSVIH